jgi:hypothetical protein
MNITYAVKQPLVRVHNALEWLNVKVLYLTLLAGLILAPALPTFAQTPVPIVIDTNEIFTQTNNWIDVFLPIVAIGAGISIALAILTFIVKQIVSAF